MKLTPKNIKEIAEDWDNVRDAVFEYQNTLHEDELNDNEIREHLNKTKMWKDEKLWLYNEREFLDYLVGKYGREYLYNADGFFISDPIYIRIGDNLISKSEMNVEVSVQPAISLS